MNEGLHIGFSQVNTGDWQLKDKGDNVKMKGEFTVNGKTYEVSVKISKTALQGASPEETKEKIQKFFDNFKKEHLETLSGHTMTASLDGKHFSVMKGETKADLDKNQALSQAVDSVKDIVGSVFPNKPDKEEISKPLQPHLEMKISEEPSRENPKIQKKSEQKNEPSRQKSEPPPLLGTKQVMENLNKLNNQLKEKESSKTSPPPLNILEKTQGHQQPISEKKQQEEHENKESNLQKENKEQQEQNLQKKEEPPKKLQQPPSLDTREATNFLQKKAPPKDESLKSSHILQQPIPENKSKQKKESSENKDLDLQKENPKIEEKPEQNLEKNEPVVKKHNPLPRFNLKEAAKAFKNFGKNIKEKIGSTNFSKDDFYTPPKKTETSPPDYVVKFDEITGPRYIFIQQVTELFISEQKFYVPVQKFLGELEKQTPPSGKEKDFQELKNCLKEIVDHGKSLLQNLGNCINIKDKKFNLDQFKKLVADQKTKDYFSALANYSKNYENFLSLFVKTKITDDKKVEEFTTLAKKLGEDEKNDGYAASRLIMPIQRGPRHTLFLNEFIKLSSHEEFNDPKIKEAMPGLSEQIKNYVSMSNDIKQILGLKFQAPPQKPKSQNQNEIGLFIEEQNKVNLENKKQISNVLDKLLSMKSHGFPIGGLLQSLLKEKAFLEQKHTGQTLKKFTDVSGLKIDTVILLLQSPQLLTTKKFANLDKDKAFNALKDLKEQGWDVDAQIKRLEKKLKPRSIENKQNFDPFRKTI